MKLKKFIPYMLPLALTVSWSAHAGNDIIDTFTLNAYDNNNGDNASSFTEGLSGTFTYDVNTSSLLSGSITQTDNSPNTVPSPSTFVFDLSNNNSSGLTFAVNNLVGSSNQAQTSFTFTANPGQTSPLGFGGFTVTVDGAINSFTPVKNFSIDPGPSYIYAGNFSDPTYNLAGTLSLTGQTTPTVPDVPVVPEPEEWAMMLLGMPLLAWAVRRKQAGAAKMSAMPA